MLGSVVTVVVVVRAEDGNPLDDVVCLNKNDVSHADVSCSFRSVTLAAP